MNSSKILSVDHVKYKVYSFRIERPVRTRNKDLTYSVSKEFKIETSIEASKEINQ